MAQRQDQYRFVWGRTRAGQVLAGLVVMFLVLGGGGCAGAGRSQALPDQESARQEGVNLAQELYASMVDVFEEETAGVDLRIEERLTVVSRYEELSEHRRRRFVGRVVAVGRGMGVNITAQYQRAIGQGEDGVRWEDIAAEEVAQEASALELGLAREVERRFHRQKS